MHKHNAGSDNALAMHNPSVTKGIKFIWTYAVQNTSIVIKNPDGQRLSWRKIDGANNSA